jgi:zinc protease
MRCSRPAALAALAWLLALGGPAVVSAGEDLELPAVERVTLDNGLRLVVAEYHKLPLVELILVVGSGAAQDPEGKSGLANLVAGALRRGTAVRGAQAFAEAVEGLGGEVSGNAGHDTTTLNAEFLAKDFGAGLDLVAEMVLRPAFSRDELRRERDEVLAALRARYEDPSAIADVCYAGFLFRGHPYGRPVEGRPKTVAALSRRDVLDFYGRHYRPNNAIAVAIGDLPAAALIERLRGAFGGWPAGPPAPPAPPVPARWSERRILLVDKPGATQAQIRLGNVGIARRDPDYIVAQVANTALGGGFSSRLIAELRVKRSLTYAAWSAFVARRVPGDFRVGTFTKVPTTGATVRLALAEVGRYRTEPPAAEELDRARNYLRGQFPLRIQTPDALASRLAEIEWHGLPLDELATYRSRVARVGAAEVAAFVDRAVPPPGTMAVVVVAPASVAAELEGLGPLEITTPEGCEQL